MEKFLKDSDLLNRRTLLSSGALVGLGALLAACGQQANSEASASSAATDAASATPSESASASAAAPESPTANATPSTVRGYSGGSKAPDGEYRPADKYGNAQNVPKPSLPEEGYNEKSLEGLRKTMDAWIKWGNYGMQTGDYSMARQSISPTFEVELKEYDDIEELYRRGGWVIDGIENLRADGAPWSEDERLISGRHTENGTAKYTLNTMVAGVDGITTIRLMTLSNMN